MVTDWQDEFRTDRFDPLHTLRGRKLNHWIRDLLDQLLDACGWDGGTTYASAGNLDSLYWLYIMNTSREDAG